MISRLLLLTSLVLPGCVGPASVRLTRPHYNESVKLTNERELLLNLVRLRYNESPYYIAVSSITAQFAADSTAGFSAEADAGRSNYFGFGDIQLGDRPTISYTPQQSAEFLQALATPLDLKSVTFLLRSNWNADQTLRITVKSINGIKNAITAGGPTPSVAPEYVTFRQAAALGNELRQRGWIELITRTVPRVVTSVPTAGKPSVHDAVVAAKEGFELETEENMVQVVTSERELLFAINPQFVHTPEIAQFCQLLRLQHGLPEYVISLADKPDFESLNAPFGVPDLRIRTRSLDEIMYYMSKGVTVPEEHFGCGVAKATRDAAGNWFNWQDVIGDLFVVRVCKHRPTDKLRVKYRGYWYYIADDDQPSKETLLLLNDIFYLIQVEVQQQGPLLTLQI